MEGIDFTALNAVFREMQDGPVSGGMITPGDAAYITAQLRTSAQMIAQPIQLTTRLIPEEEIEIVDSVRAFSFTPLSPALDCSSQDVLGGLISSQLAYMTKQELILQRRSIERAQEHLGTYIALPYHLEEAKKEGTKQLGDYAYQICMMTLFGPLRPLFSQWQSPGDLQFKRILSRSLLIQAQFIFFHLFAKRPDIARVGARLLEMTWAKGVPLIGMNDEESIIVPIATI
jgi:hypothetical protein